MDFDNEKFREYIKEKQYHINQRDEWIASKYGNKLLYNEIIELRLIALRQTLIKYDVEVITDIPWGKGLLEYRIKWEEMMNEAVKIRNNKEKTKCRMM